MSKYMMIFLGGSYESLSPQDTEQQMNKWFSWVGKLQQEGKYHSGEALLPGGKVISQKNGRFVVDGPFAESKEAVGGYFVVDAKSIDEAVEMSKEYPDFHLGGKVEVREVMNFDSPQ